MKAAVADGTDDVDVRPFNRKSCRRLCGRQEWYSKVHSGVCFKIEPTLHKIAMLLSQNSAVGDRPPYMSFSEG